MTGLIRPVFGPDHLRAMISIDIVSAQLGGHNIWRISLAFVGAMAVGGTLAIRQVGLPYTELGIAASVLVLGIGIVFAHRPHAAIADHGLIAFFGALHGMHMASRIPGPPARSFTR